MDYEVIVIGGGPAGLAAGTELARAGHRVLLLDKSSFGGQVINTEWVDDYPAPGEGIAGPTLASRLVEEAADAGVEMELGEVAEVESYSACRSVRCVDGKTFTAQVVIVAAGIRPKKLGVPGEDRFEGRGVIHCAFCDAGFYTDRPVAVAGGGDAGLTEALLLAKYASKVHVIEAGDRLTGAPRLQERARGEPKLEMRFGSRIVAIEGDTGVTAVVVQDASGERETLEVHGVLAHIGFEPAGIGFEGFVDLDDRGYIRVGDDMQTNAPGILAAGDVRSGSSRRVVAALQEGKTAAATARRLLVPVGT